MRDWFKRCAVVLVVAGALGGFATHANATPSKLCAYVGVYVYPIDSITKCVAMP